MLLADSEPSPPRRVSVIVPVLRWARTLEDTVQKLIADSYPAKEIIVAIDEPTPATLDIVHRFGSEVTFRISDQRRGKVNAMQTSYAACSGDVILFLDSDIVIRTRDIVSRTVAEIAGYDLLEMKKGVVIEGLLSNIIHYEYLGFNAANWMLAKRTNKTLGVNGAGFAMTREAYERIGGFRNVVSEDLDLGLRAYLKDLKFKYTEDIQVDTFAPAGLKGWWKQRKRWSFGAAVWFHDNYRPLFASLKQHPGVFAAGLVMIFPTFLSVLFGLTIKNMAIIDLLALAMLSFSEKSFPLLLPTLLPYGALPNLLGIGMAMLVGLFSYAAVFVVFSRKLGYRFQLRYFILYYLIYSPVWFVATLWGLVTVLVRKETIEIDWKV